MNCCDDFGRCVCDAGGKPEGRSCEELGVRKGIKAAAPIVFAPGAIEGHKAPFFGSPVQRRELVRQAKRAALFLALVGLAAFSAGLIAGGLS